MVQGCTQMTQDGPIRSLPWNFCPLELAQGWEGMSPGGARWFGCVELIHIEKQMRSGRESSWSPMPALPSIPRTEASSFPFMPALAHVAFVSLAAQSPHCSLSSLPVQPSSCALVCPLCMCVCVPSLYGCVHTCVST